MQWLADLLRRPYLFIRISLFVVLIPFGISFVPTLLVPSLVSMILILVFLYAVDVIEYLKTFVRADIFQKLTVGMFSFGFLFSLYFLSAIANLGVSPLLVALISFVCYTTYYLRIQQRISDFAYIPVFKGDTTVTNHQFRYNRMTEVFVITIMTASVAYLFESFISSRATQFFTIGALRWLLVLVLVGAHLIVDLAIDEQLHWENTNKPTEFDEAGEPPLLTGVESPIELGIKMRIYAQKNDPGDEFWHFIRDNLEELTKQVQQVNYTLFMHYLVRGFAYWGRSTRDKLHLLNILVVSSLSRYRVIGRIPLYNRHMIYSYLQVLYCHQILTPEWMDLLRYEATTQREAQLLGWIFDDTWEQRLGEWLAFWEGHIFKNQWGFEHIENYLPGDSLSDYLLELGRWEEDIWQTTYNALSLFLGSESRQLFKREIKEFKKLRYISAGLTLEELGEREEEKKEEKKERRVPVNSVVSKPSVRLSNEEKRKRVEAYLRDDDFDALTDSSLHRFDDPSPTLGERLHGFLLGSFIKILMILILTVANLFVLSQIRNFTGDAILQIIVVLEILLLFLLSFSDTQETNLDQEQADTGDLANPYSQQRLGTEFDSRSAYILLYLFTFLAGFYYLL